MNDTVCLTEAEVQQLVNDLHALMWYGDGCEICAHKVVEKRSPFYKLGCGIGCDNCKPIWQGFKESADE